LFFAKIIIVIQEKEMPNIKSAKKRMRQNEKRRARNRITKKNLRTNIKKAILAVEGEDQELAVQQVRLACKKLDKTAQKGVIKKNTAGRKKSRLMKKLNAMSATS